MCSSHIGGFIGVDVFFVLSGYLITSLLKSEVESSGDVNLANFYSRRIRRLMASSTLTIICTLLLGWAILGRVPLQDLQADAQSAALFIANIHFYKSQTDYSNQDKQPSMLLHFWSLAVEEQFYMFWPLIVKIFAYISLKHHCKQEHRLPTYPTSPQGAVLGKFACMFIGLGGIASFLWAQHSLETGQVSFAFFNLLTRAWELLSGCFLALITRWESREQEAKHHITKRPVVSPESTRATKGATDSSPTNDKASNSGIFLNIERKGVDSDDSVLEIFQQSEQQVQRNCHLTILNTLNRTVISFLGISAILACAHLYDHETRFPGLGALWPVLGTIGLLLVPAESSLGRLLSIDSLQWLGDASYTIYLFHWPCICAVKFVVANLTIAVGSSSATVTETMVLSWSGMLAGVALAAIVYRGMESPIRNWEFLKSFRRAVIFMFLLIASSLLCVHLITQNTENKFSGGVGGSAAAIAVTNNSQFMFEKEILNSNGTTPVNNIVSNTAVVNGLQFSNANQSSLIYANALVGLHNDFFTVVETKHSQCAHSLVLDRHRVLLEYYATTPRSLPTNLDPPLADRFYGGSKTGCKPIVPPNIAGDVHSNRSLVLIGDSHTVAMSFAMDRVCKKLGLRLYVIIYYSVDGLFSSPTEGVLRLKPHVELISKKIKPEYIIFHCSFGYPRKVVYETAVEQMKTFKSLASRRFIFLSDVNRLPYNDVEECLIRNKDNIMKCASPPVNRDTLSYIQPALDAGVPVVDPMDIFCTQQACPLVFENILVMQDCNHITERFSNYIGPLMTRKLQPYLT